MPQTKSFADANVLVRVPVAAIAVGLAVAAETATGAAILKCQYDGYSPTVESRNGMVGGLIVGAFLGLAVPKYFDESANNAIGAVQAAIVPAIISTLLGCVFLLRTEDDDIGHAAASAAVGACVLAAGVALVLNGLPLCGGKKPVTASLTVSESAA